MRIKVGIQYACYLVTAVSKPVGQRHGMLLAVIIVTASKKT